MLQAKIATDKGKTFTFNIHDPEYAKVHKVTAEYVVCMHASVYR